MCVGTEGGPAGARPTGSENRGWDPSAGGLDWKSSSKQGKQRQVCKEGAHWACSQCPCASGREGEKGSCSQGRREHLHTHPHRHRTPRGGGRLLLAAARPVMGIYFPQLCALVPSLSSSAQRSQVNERLHNEVITCTGMAPHLPAGP